MKLRRLQIENFRGISELDLQLGDTTVLIGENNCGKTAILDALRFALKDIRSRKGCAFDIYDFHLQLPESDATSSPPIRIVVTFKEDNAGEWGDVLLGKLARGRVLQQEEGKGVVIFEVSACYDPIRKEHVQNWRYLNLAGAELVGITESAYNLIQTVVSYYYLAALRDSAKHFDPRGPFWRPFLKDSQLTAQAKDQIESQLREVNALIVGSHATFSLVSAHLDEISRVVPVGGTENTVSIEAVPGKLFDMLSKAQVRLNAGTGAKVPLSRHGEGTQSLSVLMLFGAFLASWQEGSPFIALEEPEAHLHPSATRALWKIIARLPGQKIISTHSGDLLSEVEIGSVIRLCKNAGGISAHRINNGTLTPIEARKFNFHIRMARGELLFARTWILGEGETESTLFSELARHMDLDLEASGVRCVTYQTMSLDLALKIANAMGINWVVITDNDAQGANDIATIQGRLNGRTQADVAFTMTEKDIERYLCTQGFGSVYESYLTEQTRSRITVAAGHPSYWGQVLAAIKNARGFYKPDAALQVMTMIKAGAPIPPLFGTILQKAIQLATHQ